MCCINKKDINNLIDGNIEFDSKSLIVNYMQNNKLVIPLSRASSGVSQLASLIIRLQGLSKSDIKRTPMIIVEEPEINLHANHQLIIADFLAKCSASCPMLITTHSEYLLSRLALLWSNNTVNSFNAYFIDPEKNNKAIKLKTEKNTGEIELLRTINEAIESLSNEALRIRISTKSDE